jgi:PAS domain S-box-containing protein
MKTRILIVEDEYIIAGEIELSLQSMGYEACGVAHNAKEAIRQADLLQPDIVLIDINLNDTLSGTDVAKIITEKHNIPIIYLTAYGDPATLKAAISTKPYGYILKPYKDDDLKVTIETTMNNHLLSIRLKESEKRYQLLFENAPLGYQSLDEDGKIVEVNPVWLETMGYSLSEVTGHWFGDFLTEKYREDFNSDFDIFKFNGEFTGHEYEIKKKNGGIITILFNGKISFDKSLNFLQAHCIMTDITKQKNMETALLKSREELRNLTVNMDAKMEDQSKRIAREIHDGLGQLLTAIKFDVSRLKKKTDERREGSKKLIEGIYNLVDSGVELVQKISKELRPGILDDLGLLSAIKWRMNDFRRKTGIKCKVILQPHDFDVDIDLSTAIYRITQEALTNIIRHAKASEVEIQLINKRDEIFFQIKDNGVGIPEEKVNNSMSFGLLGIRERAHLRKGILHITGKKNMGTSLSVTFPTRVIDK